MASPCCATRSSWSAQVRGSLRARPRVDTGVLRDTQQLVRAGAGFAACKAWGGHWGAICMVRGKPMLRDTQQLVRAGAGFATCKAWGGHWDAMCSDRGY